MRHYCKKCKVDTDRYKAPKGRNIGKCKPCRILYNSIDTNKEKTKAYNTTDKVREMRKGYRTTDKYKENAVAYKSTPEAKELKKTYGSVIRSETIQTIKDFSANAFGEFFEYIRNKPVESAKPEELYQYSLIHTIYSLFSGVTCVPESVLPNGKRIDIYIPEFDIGIEVKTKQPCWTSEVVANQLAQYTPYIKTVLSVEPNGLYGCLSHGEFIDIISKLVK